MLAVSVINDSNRSSLCATMNVFILTRDHTAVLNARKHSDRIAIY